MPNEVVFDIETSNSFADVGKYDPSLLKVSMVCLYSYAEDRYHSFLESELSRLWPFLERADRVIGYNLFGFDYKVLNSYYPGDLTKLPTLDLMVEIEKTVGRRLKLDDVAHGSLGTGKSGNGLMAIEYFRRGEIDRLRDYCMQDVKVTKEVYEFGRTGGFVRFLDRMGRPVEARVDFLLKEGVEPTPVSMTLPF
ncbi:ribonuclease H-like domain-containing protein [Candidatus Uhrbacteria bacterium]|nr:ribonuclease H-like domain-containing protein [Candidatus Uhrbacteria bacterium]